MMGALHCYLFRIYSIWPPPPEPCRLGTGKPTQGSVRHYCNNSCQKMLLTFLCTFEFLIFVEILPAKPCLLAPCSLCTNISAVWPADIFSTRPVHVVCKLHSLSLEKSYYLCACRRDLSDLFSWFPSTRCCKMKRRSSC